MKIIIDLPPITKKNSQQIFINGRTGKPFVAPSKKYKDYETNAGFYVMRSGRYSGEYPVNITCLFYMPTRRRVDLVNLLESADDLLTHYGVIVDDSAQYVGGHDFSRVLYDKDNPRTEIYILPLESKNA